MLTLKNVNHTKKMIIFIHSELKKPGECSVDTVHRPPLCLHNGPVGTFISFMVADVYV